MAIKTLVTRGFGNGTFSGSIAEVVTRGFAIGEAAAADPTAAFTLLEESELSATFVTHDADIYNMVAYALMAPDFGRYLLMDVVVEDQIPLIDVAQIGQVFSADRTIFVADESSQLFPTHDATIYNLLPLAMGSVDFGSYLLFEDVFEDQLPLLAASSIGGGL